jgi:hypothetical protein
MRLFESAWRRYGLTLESLYAKSSILLLVQLAGGGVLAILQLVLARLLTLADYGTMAYALGVGILVTPFVLLGLSSVTIRFTAIYRKEGAYAAIKGLQRFALTVTLSAAVAVAAGVYVFFDWHLAGGISLSRFGVVATIVFIIAGALNILQQAQLFGRNHRHRRRQAGPPDLRFGLGRLAVAKRIAGLRYGHPGVRDFAGRCGFDARPRVAPVSSRRSRGAPFGTTGLCRQTQMASDGHRDDLHPIGADAPRASDRSFAWHDARA